MSYETGQNPSGLGEFAASLNRNLAFLKGEGVVGAGEFSSGPGLDVPGYENASPREGGRYKAQSPRCPNNIGLGKAK